jgi:acetyl-CoA carboxylase carboxyl transferase subunit alpha
MAALPVPTIVTIIGEGGSGGALAVGVGNRMLMMQYSYYSVISPEACSSILFREPTKAPKAAEALKMSATDLRGFGVIDEIVTEAVGGAHRDPARTAENLGRALRQQLAQLRPLTPEELVDDRYRRFRNMGVFELVS